MRFYFLFYVLPLGLALNEFGFFFLCTIERMANFMATTKVMENGVVHDTIIVMYFGLMGGYVNLKL
jgi:hypothetical protein